MRLGEVMVFVLSARGKPGVSTMHLDADTEKVHAALRAVGRGGIVKESEAWSRRLREQYYDELRKRGLQVHIVENYKKSEE